MQRPVRLRKLRQVRDLAHVGSPRGGERYATGVDHARSTARGDGDAADVPCLPDELATAPRPGGGDVLPGDRRIPTRQHVGSRAGRCTLDGRGWGAITPDPKRRVVEETVAHLGLSAQQPARRKDANTCAFMKANIEARRAYWDNLALSSESRGKTDHPYVYCG